MLSERGWLLNPTCACLIQIRRSESKQVVFLTVCVCIPPIDCIDGRDSESSRIIREREWRGRRTFLTERC